ncbi:MAG: glycine cleavage system aminomethyltransferase GcvT [Bacteroidales bacterium]|nr:glycine cleavage system aminomethyltransferase GcvT [Bacteroidales bacterium]MCF8343920.1 glycine cleavage system aminomethyltransferase GcvT [Bacteroidales bacterium]MCF8350798.1 glycine cleavage system aminomethyltransferase GcvT [Bacteroidales bacterium]MCF8376342.1 glycine cleavage system aminomethyltransferase GcvT [Bacteroidales bacterium]MCF8400508.1 glycine cleavage system aminomethyltransferase GcvT [Bacteroidales bacterium]
MKTTALSNDHEKLGAKMVSFAGFYMPIQFEGVNAEHQTVRKGVGVFDVSHMGEFWARGPKAFDLVQRLTSNNLAKLVDGKVQYSCFPNGKGGIVDDLLVYRFNEETYLMVVNAANIEKDWQWVNEQNTVGAQLQNASDEISQLAVQGPLALKAMQKLTDENVVDMPYYTFKTIELAGVKDVILSTTGYTGSGGCEIYMQNKDAVKIYRAVLESGEEYGIKPIGLAARDTLRLESGFCLYGNDIDDTTSPLEAGLGWITKFEEGNNFIDREYLEKQKEEGLQKRLRGFEMIDKGIPRQHYDICDEGGQVIGEVTSGTMSPMLKIGIGMGYIQKGYNKFDSEIFIKVRNKLLKAKVVRIPFYKG